MRQMTGVRRIGHAGTLDPLASGVLVLCLGKATRLSEYLLGENKRYRAIIRLGQITSTYDSEGEITQVREVKDIGHEQVRQNLTQFRGDLMQIPPRYSAIKRDGRKLYERARAGEDFTPPSRLVHIHELHLSTWSAPDLEIEVLCSAGTYIRSLAHDIGQALGCGAHLVKLVRLASGHFRLEDAHSPASLANAKHWRNQLISPEWPFKSWHHLSLADTEFADFQHGRKIQRTHDWPTGALAMAMAGGELIAVARSIDGGWRPIKLLKTNLDPS